ncbi:S-adenosyl-L-methionine-dependent methyltransferase [Aspergillus alliaceus]|uniref:S-adenosyl-L-methionine-dependent methyltransferase n=1 Tax=Petromyces alliaceus TaxID=209559 RepID=UPI0012A4E457|nr:S-adenosyl-L-methionine-dependent methyltransferase [Aspergillus alliaceus]KAB8234284.1 S-adenosyl-L-methionine-dependent methyltransferase [Aspergillus alliaceus]
MGAARHEGSPRSDSGSPSREENPQDEYAGELDYSADSDYVEEFASDTTSLNSMITAYRYENGRRYHAYRDGAYWGPNDEMQNEQLDIAHHMFTMLLGDKLCLAPISDNIQRVLDVGTGTGIWAIDFADEYPSAEVIGTDLSPTQPTFVPPNLRFEVDDAEDSWAYPENHFDLIHVRSLYGAISNWPAFYRNMMIGLRPGGWFDQLEMSIEFRSDDGTVTYDHILAEWSRIFIDAGERFGKTFRICDLARDYMLDVGFENVTERRFKLPVGPWTRDEHYRKLGMWNLLHCEKGIEGWAMALLTRVMGWSYEEVQLFLASMRRGLRDYSRIHAYFYVVSVYGQKPLKDHNADK